VPAAPQAGPAAQQKRLVAGERDEAARAAWRADAAARDPAARAFVDATSTHTALTRLRARAPRGTPAVGSAPRNRGPNVTLLAALTPAGVAAPLVVEGAADGAVFAAYVEQCLAPALRPGQAVVLDNLSVRRGERARAAVAAAGCRLRLLPASPPDFNPIEPAFAKLKEHLRRLGARAFDPLVEAIGQGLTAITAADARGFFAHAGDPLPDQDF
jgi:transposase